MANGGSLPQDHLDLVSQVTVVGLGQTWTPAASDLQYATPGSKTWSRWVRMGLAAISVQRLNPGQGGGYRVTVDSLAGPVSGTSPWGPFTVGPGDSVRISPG